MALTALERPRGERFLIESGESRLRLQTSVRLRWFAVLGQLLAVAAIYLGLGFQFPLGACLLGIAASAWLNVILRFRFPARHRLSPELAFTLLIYDTLQLAYLLYLTGGIQNPFVFLIVAPVTVSATSLGPRSTVLLGLLAMVAASILVFYYGPLPWMADQRLDLPLLYRLGLLGSVAVGLLFLALYASRLSKEARQMSAALAASDLVLAHEQKLHALDGLAAAAAHELGSPLGTILLVTKELTNSIAPDHPLREDLALLQTQAARCRDILQKLTRQPNEQDPLHASLSVGQLLDEATGPYRGQRVKIILDVGPNAGLGLHERDAALEPIGERRPGVIYALGNLIENAVDFARSSVIIKARWDESHITIEIADDGPGFPQDVLETLGEPYVTTRPLAASRAKSSRSGNLKSSGLGLGFFIAKTLIERSGGRVELANRLPKVAAQPEATGGLAGDAAPAPHAASGGALVRIGWSRAAFEAGLVDGAGAAWPPRKDARQPAPAAKV